MRQRTFSIALLFLSILVSAQFAMAVTEKKAQSSFSELTLTNSRHHLLLFATLENGFTDEMIKGLHTGLPLQFAFFVEMNQTNEGGKDSKILDLETRHVISYDTLKETYKVEIEESGKRFFSFDNLIDAQKLTNEINGLKVIELSQLKPNTSYTIRIRAELYKKSLPMGLHQVVPFVSLWDVRTKWFDISFTL